MFNCDEAAAAMIILEVAERRRGVRPEGDIIGGQVRVEEGGRSREREREQVSLIQVEHTSRDRLRAG